MQENDRQLVIQALGSLPAERFAVVDGAHFDNLPKELDIWQLEHKALYLEKLGETPSTAGPYLVTLPDWEAANRVLSLVGELPAVVFWSWGDGQPSLYKHLRRINMIEIPVDDFDPELPKYDRVLFRHGDPNVMASMLSVLDEGKFMHLIGGAAGLVMFAGDEGGLRVAQRISDMGADNQGILRLSAEQYEALKSSKVNKVSANVRNYLKKCAPEQTKSMSDDQLNAHVATTMKESLNFGVTSEASHCRWSYMQLLSGNKLAKNEAVGNMMMADAPGISANERVKILMNRTISTMKKSAR